MPVTAIRTAIPIPYEEIAAFCERHHLTRMWLFGSVLRDDFDAASDVDVLVEFDPNHIPGWEFYSWEDELAAILGRKVDLGTPSSLRSWLKERIMDSAQVIYERT